MQRVFVAFVAFAAVPMFPAAAQETVSIGGGPTSGVAAVNVAAGNQNQQLNAGSFAQGEQAIAQPAGQQHLGGPASPATATATATITDGAFAGSSGWTAVSGVAGSDNQQANLAAFAFGIEAGSLADLSLSQTRASTQPTGASTGTVASAERSVGVADSAFAGSSGLVQVSLIGGDRNSSANTFALTVVADAGP